MWILCRSKDCDDKAPHSAKRSLSQCSPSSLGHLELNYDEQSSVQLLGATWKCGRHHCLVACHLELWPRQVGADGDPLWQLLLESRASASWTLSPGMVWNCRSEAGRLGQRELRWGHVQGGCCQQPPSSGQWPPCGLLCLLVIS